MTMFSTEEFKVFCKSPDLWKCNCGKPRYSATITSYGQVMCGCGHVLTKIEYEAYLDAYKRSICEVQAHIAHSVTMAKAQETPRNHGRKNDSGKLRADLLLEMPRALKAVAFLMQEALAEYDEGSWLTVENAEKRYRAALMRHILDRAIDYIDPQFNLDHDVAIATNALFALELRLRRQEAEAKSALVRRN